jgi:hypothetical protein
MENMDSSELEFLLNESDAKIKGQRQRHFCIGRHVIDMTGLESAHRNTDRGLEV